MDREREKDMWNGNGVVHGVGFGGGGGGFKYGRTSILLF